jgi:hypothetical protein
VEAVEFLGGILARTDERQSKKTAMLRKLSISENLLPKEAPTLMR